MQNAAIAAEATTVLDLVTMVVKNVVANEHGRLKVQTDCKVVCDLLVSERTKSSQLILDGGSAIRKIIEIEKESKMKFECIHVRTKYDNDKSGNSCEKNLALECDYKAKEVRLKRENDYKNDNIRFRGNVCLKHKDRCCDRKISEVIKKIDSVGNSWECFQDEHGEKWISTDAEAREGFVNCT